MTDATRKANNQARKLGAAIAGASLETSSALAEQNPFGQREVVSDQGATWSRQQQFHRSRRQPGSTRVSASRAAFGWRGSRFLLFADSRSGLRAALCKHGPRVSTPDRLRASVDRYDSVLGVRSPRKL